jgi:choline dehydrogenase
MQLDFWPAMALIFSASSNTKTSSMCAMLIEIICLGWEKLPEKLRANFTKEIREALASFPADWPEVEYLPISAYFGDQFNYITGAPTDGFNYASVMASSVAPLSRGTVSIDSADTSDLPVIDPKWLDHPVDKAVAIAAFKRTRELWHSPSFQSDEEILQFLKTSFSTINHGCCTCAMGRVKDPNAVLDSHARVIGVDGLRVVDASAFPLLPPGHPQATVCKDITHHQRRLCPILIETSTIQICLQKKSLTT